MPSLSPTMSQGNIASWKKAEGDEVAAGDVLCEVETDKATIEWESVEEGYVAKILLPDGSKDVPVGTVVAVLCEEAGDVAKFESYSAPVEAAGSGSDLVSSSDEGAAEEEAERAAAAPASGAGAALNLPPHAILGMPSLSPTMTQGSLSSWKKSEGDAIEAGEILAEVETDKATIEWEAVDGGFLAKVLVADGTSDIEIGTPVAIVCEEEDDLKAFANVTSELLSSGSPAEEGAPAGDAAAAAAVAAAAPSTPAPSSPAPAAMPRALSKKTGHVAASPLAKAIASEGGVDLSMVAGTGPEGRVIAADVREFMESRPALAAAGGAAASPYLGEAVGGVSYYEDVEVSQMRSIIAHRLLESKRTIPHYYLTMDCEVDALMSLRASVNESMAESSAKGTKVSLNDFVIKAAALSCRAVPECNAEWREDFIRVHKNVHVGVAMDLGSLGHSQGGLIVPVLRNVEAKGVSEISATVKDYAARAKPADGVDGKMRLALEELDGGTFTVTNLGMFGVKQFAAIVNPPQSAILAVGAVRSEVKKDDSGDFKEAKLMSVTLSCDHRVVDGAVGSKWLQHFKELVENPLQMLI